MIPKELRNAFGLDRDTRLAFAVDGDAMIRERPELTCVFCGTGEHVTPHCGRGICVECVREVRELASGG